MKMKIINLKKKVKRIIFYQNSSYDTFFNQIDVKSISCRNLLRPGRAEFIIFVSDRDEFFPYESGLKISAHANLYPLKIFYENTPQYTR